MSRYIDADKAIDAIEECVCTSESRLYLKDLINGIPSADVVKVIRCKDCMWGNNKTRSGKRYCELSDMYQVDDGFCNWGEKIK